jgi:putative hemolysin
MAPFANTPGDPFALRIAPQTFLARAAIAAARPALSRVLKLSDLRALYQRSQTAPGESFEARALHALDVRIQVRSINTAIPARGPLIVAANHPTGALDGLVLAEVLLQVRSDVRLVANYLLHCLPELRERCFFVDPFATGALAASRSSSGLRAAHLWLRGGGALIVFPAGEVAWRPPATNASAATYVDSPWAATVGRLAQVNRANVLPVFLGGHNSRAFYAAGRVHPVLRTLMLGRELVRSRGTTVYVHLGAPIAAESMRGAGTPAAATAEVRRAVDAIAVAPQPRAAIDVAPPVDPTLLDRDIQALPATARLLSSGALDVFCCGADALPHVLLEIGRLREETFRAVGEGTGRSIDLDRFDRHYEHLFVWNRSRLEVVGAYRVGATDRVVPIHGVNGLYTTTLFRYDECLLRRTGPALELGRSFVRQEYQRTYNALLLLWKGIGRLVSQAPRYRVLYGPVSISRRYTDVSQQLLRAFVAQHHGDPELASLVQPVNPPAPLVAPPRDARPLADVGELETLVQQLEGQRGIPVLLRQYLRLQATLLGFSVDPAFGDALDALMMVDLCRLPHSLLQRYLGAAEARAFRDAHTTRSSSQARVA